MDNVHMNDDEDLDLDLVNQDQDHNPESPQHVNTGGHSISYQPGMKTKMKVQTDSYNSKMLNSMLRRNGEQEYSEDRSSN